MRLRKHPTKCRNKALELASHKLECRSEDLDLVNGEIFVKGTPEKKITLRMLAHEAANRVSGFMVDRSVEPGLEATVYCSPRRSTHSNGVHVAVVNGRRGNGSRRGAALRGGA